MRAAERAGEAHPHRRADRPRPHRGALSGGRLTAARLAGLRVRVAVETTSPKIVAARNLHDRFKTMVAAKTDDLTSWLRDAQGSELAFFASGIVDDKDAVRAAIVELWSNGQMEGQVTKLKLVRRQIYGRGKIYLLQDRMVQPG